MLTKEEKQIILERRYTTSFYAPWADAALFQRMVENLAEAFRAAHIEKVLGLEARGFILGAPVAYLLHAGFVVARKAGNLYKGVYTSENVLQESCIDYSGQKKGLEIETHAYGIQPGERILIVDDWFERGEQGLAAVRLVERAGGIVAGIGILFDEMTAEKRKSFQRYHFHALIQVPDA
ncbi:adenine phosphoribosyltransferase [Ktedonosporobacter rubrisoli]|uniref:Adenine phosphoribosyltransferase n=1 Tax=Ktedonosporobacter rubrisoli TaxID=2509675 RepID=A0A4P6JXS6_KTERU|nr:phosphoribosyltransferase family protein [Ktedonosporobacter rubrisoli]QBD80190.1 adenine phosphoribosyltransferase [Ktedonosporobacter rubrisoli]